jgi:hypothetical protein
MFNQNQLPQQFRSICCSTRAAVQRLCVLPYECDLKLYFLFDVQFSSSYAITSAAVAAPFLGASPFWLVPVQACQLER